MLSINLMAAYLAQMWNDHRARNGDEGEITVTGVIWIALFAAATIAIATLIIAKVKGKAASIPLG